MENENILDLNNHSAGSLAITSAATSYLKETAGWGKFLGILGFIGTGLMVVVGVFMGTLLQSMGQETPFGSFIGVFYALLGLLYFFPSLYLFKYASKLKSALASKDTAVLTQAFENEKSMFKFVGILMIILLGLYALIFVFGFFGALFV